MKKLLVTASTFPRWINDTEPRFVLDLSSALLKKYDVTVLAPATAEARTNEMINGVKIIRYHYFPIHKFETLCYPGAIVPRIKEKKIRILLIPFLVAALYINLFRVLPQYDIVHVHWLIPQGVIQSFFKKPYIVTGHGGDVTSFNKGIVRMLKIRCLKKAQYVTTVSQHLKNEVFKIYPNKDIKVIPMGCNLENFGKQFYIPDNFHQSNKKVILFVGRLAEKKGVTYLIEAMQKIDAVLVIVGDGPLKETLVKQSKDIKHKVKFLGAKTHEELKVVYASSDIFVAPSVTAKDGDQEGLGLVILEAMASGLPVIASNSGGITSIINDKVNGLLCEEKNIIQIEEKISELLKNEELYKRLVKNAMKTVGKFSYEAVAAKYIKVLDNSLKRADNDKVLISSKENKNRNILPRIFN